jgi:anaerobic selenocysteine-containing dehydrogenase
MLANFCRRRQESAVDQDVGTESHTSMCRVCTHTCAVVVHTRDGRISSITGDRENPLFRGYTCVKGRAHADLYDHPQRLTRSLKRTADGFAPIAVEQAMDQIADRIRGIVSEHGPRAVALYYATYFALDNQAQLSVVDAFARALGTPMMFSPFTTDQPGKAIAKGLHGMWMAPARFRTAEAVLLVGHNPLVSHQHRAGRPGDFFDDLAERGAELIVIDPRRTETARRATLFLQPMPGNDAAILACLIRQVLAENLQDQSFLDEHVDGLTALAAAVEPFDPETVAHRAGVEARDLVRAARILGGTRHGYATAGTGPNMSGEGTLIEYLLLCLDTVCGHWMRAGERVTNALTVIPQALQMATAQALPPFPTYGLGEPMRIRGLTPTIAGPPAAAMAEEILTPGEGQIKALISLGGNPLNSVPDQAKMHRALESLDLLVCTDVQMSPTARFADYVIAPRLAMEMPGTTLFLELGSLLANGQGPPDSYAQYSPAIVEPPAGSEVVAQWELLYGLAQRLGLELRLTPGAGDTLPAGPPVALDMVNKPTDDELLEIVHAGSRITLREIKQRPHGDFFPDPAVYVQPAAPDWAGHLQVGNPEMMDDLAQVARRTEDVDSAGYEFRLISRRLMHVMNSPTVAAPGNRPRYNAAFLHPHDMERLGIAADSVVRVASAYDEILAVAQPDPHTREGTVSMSHSFGDVPARDHEVRAIGSNPGRLVRCDAFYDRFSGQPRMSNIPVRVETL